ncbi:permease-like cell division protein FtsX [Rhizohabitans arisaemae]|uniref:permease-like cell division protein FtsX n=1 Tax=Rhizohabitans arisaemae TaxID=2720610 RepID=UPI0024B05F67|nr:permease-like cell division protein FtsX [Rhizohabitans arisaemae]
MEDRLREAMGARADSVPDSDPPLPAPKRRHAVRMGPIGTAAVILTVTASIFGAVRLAAPAAEPQQQATPLSMSLLGDEIPREGGVKVYLCSWTTDMNDCARKGATKAEKEAIRRMLARYPGVEKVTFRSREQAYKEFLRGNTGSKLAQVVRPQDLPETFHARLKAGADTAALAKAVSDLPGVLFSYDQSCAIKIATQQGEANPPKPSSGPSRGLCSYPGKGR